MRSPRRDCVVVGAGPNGLAAAIVLARGGHGVLVREANATVGGGARSAELTLPGFVHDPFSSVHPLGRRSPFFATVPLDAYGLDFCHPDLPLAHPFDDGTCAVLSRSVEETAESLGRDALAYRELMQPIVDDWPELVKDVLAPLHIPRHPIQMARFGRLAVQSVAGLVESRFECPRARALLAAIGAHGLVPPRKSPSAAFALVLGATAHTDGWPFARGGSQRIADALAAYLRRLGGTIETSSRVASLDELRGFDTVMLDLTPTQVLAIGSHWFPERYRRALRRFRLGPGVFKLDWVLAEPIPWTARECRRAGTVHLAGTLAEVERAFDEIERGMAPARPLVLLSQPTLFDSSRTPDGRQIAWAYGHVPNGSTADLTDAIEAQVERFAPGFRDTIVARHVLSPLGLEREDENLVGGDISGGLPSLRQLFFRPAVRRDPYATPVSGVYLCSSSTPPGGGVHGLCGYYAARSALGA